jgi:glycosyltransferase involved in cell wall biosynthesis
MVSDKGYDLLLGALRRLAERGVERRLTMVGEGPERGRLEGMAAGLAVRFAGVLRGEALAAELRRHRVLVVPSRWDEPFGVVALEAIACGCAVIGSSGGGLPEAIGPCGVTFPNGEVGALMDCLEHLPEPAEAARREQHLAGHRAAVVGARYLRVLEGAQA